MSDDENTHHLFNHNIDSENEMAKLIVASAKLASGQPVTDGPHEYVVTELSGGQISAFCAGFKQLDWDHSTISCDAKEKLGRIIEIFEDCHPRKVTVYVMENFTTLRGVYNELPAASAAGTAADLEKHDAAVKWNARILAHPNFAHPNPETT